jgi:hypothetical protein
MAALGAFRCSLNPAEIRIRTAMSLQCKPKSKILSHRMMRTSIIGFGEEGLDGHDASAGQPANQRARRETRRVRRCKVAPLARENDTTSHELD